MNPIQKEVLIWRASIWLHSRNWEDANQVLFNSSLRDWVN